jgi:hypothetical protein
VRAGTSIIWDNWTRGGPFVGEVKPVSRVTVEVGWMLRTQAPAGPVPPDHLPVRYFTCVDDDQEETEILNVERVSLDQSIETDAASCTITIRNTNMKTNIGLQELEGQLGQPGYFTWDRGRSSASRARWNHTPNAWQDVLVPNALIRTYQGFGGEAPMEINEARGIGYLCRTGTWLVDRVRVSTNGVIELQCRDMGKLLIEQQLYPPLVPMGVYPLKYCRYYWRTEQRQNVRQVTKLSAATGPRRCVYETTANKAWYPSGVVHGHDPAHAFDGNQESFWLSVGNSGPTEPYSVEWIQALCGEAIDTVRIHPWAGNYNVYISVMENGAWQGGAGTIPYQEAGIGRYNGQYEARIPAVMKVGCPWETSFEVKLPRVFNAERVRLTFTNLAKSQWGPYPYRAGLREMGLGLSTDIATTETIVETFKVQVKDDGNYKDYSEIVKELLLWSGWFLCGTDGEVFGNIESTGAYSEECLPVDMFDKKPVIDAITAVKEIVGYVFFIDSDGGAHFESPNWWQAGTLYEDGTFTTFIPEIDERLQLTEYGIEFSDSAARSEIIISTADPEKDMSGTLTTRFVPPTADILRGIVRPAMWTNGVFTNAAEQAIMAELIAMHIWFSMRQGQITCVANPAIQINDQVRIQERQTGDTYIHYVRGIRSDHDLRSGAYTMTLTTHWLGDSDNWAVKRPS